MVAQTLRVGLRAAGLAVGIAMLARVLMRLVALDTFDTGGFSLVGTLGICFLFVLAGAAAAVARSLTERRWVIVVVVLVTSALLWESDVAIGLSSFGAAREQPMTAMRWVGFWSLFVAISALAVLTPYVGARTGRGAKLRRAGSRHALASTANQPQ